VEHGQLDCVTGNGLRQVTAAVAYTNDVSNTSLGALITARVCGTAAEVVTPHRARRECDGVEW
jgi:hypothetical protein